MKKEKDLRHYQGIVFDIRNDLAVSCRRKMWKYGDAVLASLTELIDLLQQTTREALDSTSLSYDDKSSLWGEVELLLEQFKSARTHLRAIQELQKELMPYSNGYTYVKDRFLQGENE